MKASLPAPPLLGGCALEADDEPGGPGFLTSDVSLEVMLGETLASSEGDPGAAGAGLGGGGAGCAKAGCGGGCGIGETGAGEGGVTGGVDCPCAVGIGEAPAIAAEIEIPRGGGGGGCNPGFDGLLDCEESTPMPIPPEVNPPPKSISDGSNSNSATLTTSREGLTSPPCDASSKSFQKSFAESYR